MAGPDVVPAYIRQVLEDLQALAMAKSLLMKEAVSNLPNCDRFLAVFFP